MRLLVPANWDRELVPPLSRIKADIEVYGVLPTSMIGSGGSGPNIPQMTLEQAEEFIRLAHSAGLTFNYLLNAPCMNNMEWDEATHQALREQLAWLCDIGVEGVTVAIPYLLELVKCQFPNLRLEISTISHVNSVARAEFFESLGADAIMLDANINRDFKLLKAIRKAVKCELGILTNSSCLYQCPYEYYHNNTLGHASQNHNQLNGCYMDYCVLHCSLDNFNDLSQLIKARWIRPEDIHIYEELGIDFFKVGGRAMPTEWIVNATEAYAALSYPGNLHDILNNFSPKTKSVAANLSSTQITTIASLPKVYIDNQALDGFIDFFKKQDCLSECGRCQYCQEVANKVVKIDRGEVDEYIAVLRKLLDDLAHSNMFEAKTHRTAGQISTRV
jgi:collagenase-like PrtC family protease